MQLLCDVSKRLGSHGGSIASLSEERLGTGQFVSLLLKKKHKTCPPSYTNKKKEKGEKVNANSSGIREDRVLHPRPSFGSSPRKPSASPPFPGLTSHDQERAASAATIPPTARHAAANPSRQASDTTSTSRLGLAPRQRARSLDVVTRGPPSPGHALAWWMGGGRFQAPPRARPGPALSRPRREPLGPVPNT